jgi:photosystem II stability/assembly factor-like uncharacterized protein
MILLLALLLAKASYGHSPHHIITDVSVSPTSGPDGQAYILITDQIFRSDKTGDVWKLLENGLNNQYAFTSVVISPGFESDGTVFVSSAGDGVYRSTERGESWSKFNNGLDSLDIASLSVSADYERDHRILAAAESGGVWRFNDAENRWRMVLTENVRVADFSEAMTPDGQSIVFAGDLGGGVWRSDDSGLLWELVYEFPNGLAVNSIASYSGDVFVGTREDGLYHSRDSGRSFLKVDEFQAQRLSNCRGRELEQPVNDPYITSIMISADNADDPRVFVTTWFGGVFVSDDLGQSWSTWNEGLSCDQQADDLSVAHYRRVIKDTSATGLPVYWVAAFDGLFRGTGDNAQWQQLETLPLGQIKGMAVGGGTDRFPAIALATYGGGFYLTEDAGSNWTIGNKGLKTTRLTGMSFSPNYETDGVIYAGAFRELLRTSDRGQSWQGINLDPPSFGRRIVNKLRSWGMPSSWFSSSDASSRYPVYPTFIVMPPDRKNDRVLFATRFHGVMSYEHASGDIASVWGGTDKIMNSLEMSPAFAQDETMFASIRGLGVFRSEDNGANWTDANTGLHFLQRWSDSPDGGDFRRDVKLAISNDYRSDRIAFAGSPAGDGLYMTKDGGKQWSPVTGIPQFQPTPVLAIALSPEFGIDGTMLVSVKGQGVFRSEDYGLSFESIGDHLKARNISIELLEFSPNYANDQSVIAASDEQLLISRDSGATWEEVLRPVRYEDMRDVIKYEGSWEQRRSEKFSAMTDTITSGDNSSVQLRFVGGGVRWIGSTGPDHGIAQVYLDGELVETIDCYADAPGDLQTLFVTQNLKSGAHTIEVRLVPPTADRQAGVISIDAFDVLPAARILD